MKTRKYFHKPSSMAKILFILLFICSVSTQSSLQNSTQKKCLTFQEFIKKFEKNYETKEEYNRRQSIYNRNILKIEEQKTKKICQVNTDFDMLEDEISSNYLAKAGLNLENPQINKTINKFIKLNHYSYQKRILIQSTKNSYDWRNHTNFTQVKNSGSCGASHSFVTAAFFEQEIIKAGLSDPSIDLSEMYLMNCNPENTGCNPSLVEPLLDLVIKKGGIPLESQYRFDPFSVPQKICLEKSFFNIPNITRVSYYEVKDPEQIKKIIFQKPVIASVCGVDMASYSPDPNDPLSRTLRCNPHNRVKDHHVLLVGYTETEWIVKNSWGSNWGIDGYGYISNNNAEDCCIGDQIHTTGIKTPDCSVMYCQSCVQEKLCKRCVPGRYVFYNISTGIQTCEQCKELNCQECYNHLGTCKWCLDGFSIDWRTNKCAYSAISNCNRIENGLCIQCKPGFKLSSDKLKCIESCQVTNCQKCPQGSCLSCKSGYNMLTPTVNGKQIQVCKLNSCSVPNCSLCNSGGSCIKCATGYLLNSSNSQCYSTCLITDCISCNSSSTQCDICIGGKSWNKVSKVCEVLASTPNCKQFNVNCTSCKEGYHLETIKTNPVKCVQICQQQSCSECLLNDISYCNTCKDGYTLNVTSYSSKCYKNPCSIQGCSLCNSDGTQCVKCTNEFFVFNSGTNQCQNQCSILNCRDCLPNDLICSTCNQGYVFNTDNQTCVEQNITNCVQVYYAGSGPLEQFCLQCKQNFYVSKVASSFDKQCLFECKASNCQKCNQQMPYVCEKCSKQMYPKLVNGSLQCQYPRKQFKNCAFPSLNQTYCFVCDQFYFRNQQTGLCQLHTQNCPGGCEYCTPPGYSGGFSCKCKNGLFFNKVNNQCMPNPFNDTNCIVGSFSASYSYCGTCVQGMIVNYTSWNSCTSGCYVQNCKSCVSQNYMVCQICNQGFYLNNRLQCSQCTVNIPNCQTCFLSKCTLCKPGYHLAPNGMQCNPIKCNNKQIYDGLNCVCPSGTYYGNLTCNICNQPNCDICNKDSCFLCNGGFYLAGNQCKKCIPHCKKCTQPSNNCIQCQEGYFYDSNLQICLSSIQVPKHYNFSSTSVIICPSNCLQCTSELKCTKCLTNYHQIRGQCYSCLNNCRTCLRTNLAICTSCNSGYHLVSTKNCIKCTDTHCKNCQISQKVCISCNRGYFLDNGSCKPCQIQSCAQCKNVQQCTQCSPGYTLMKDFTCQQCGGNCRSCNSSAINQCFTACNSTSYLLNNTCVSCPVQCKTCLSESVCLSCMNGYNLRNGQCSKACQKGCYQCDQSNTAKCLKCFNLFTLAENGTCFENTGCNNDQSCTFCPQGWALNNGVCYTCQNQNDCRQCSNKNLTFCTECKEGFYPLNGTCFACNQSCQVCFGPEQCAICKDGYFKAVDSVVSNCVKCSSMCKTCIDFAQKCTSCDEGYELTVTDKCLRKAKIQGTIQLGIALSEFPSSSRLIRKSILSCIGSNYENETKHYIITKLQEGSTIVTFTVSIPDGLEETSTFEAFRTNIASLSQISGIAIISTSQINLLNGNTDANPNNGNLNPIIGPSSNQSDDTKNLAIILGVVIPISVIALILLGCLIKRKLYNKRIIIEQQIGNESVQEDQKSNNHNPKFNETIEFSVLQPSKKNKMNESGYQKSSAFSQQSNERLKSVENPSTVVLVKQRKKSKRNSSAINSKNKQHLNVIDNFVDDLMENNEKTG